MNELLAAPQGYKRVELSHHDWCEVCHEQINRTSIVFSKKGEFYCAECLFEWMPFAYDDSNKRNKSKTRDLQLVDVY